jgi:hypothetical protein
MHCLTELLASGPLALYDGHMCGILLNGLLKACDEGGESLHTCFGSVS